MIAVHYTPSTFTTAECELKFRTTEFGSEPVLCRIVGNALPTKQNVQQPDKITSEDQAAQEYDVKKTKTRTLLTNKKEAMRTSSRAGVRLDKIPDSHLSFSKAEKSQTKAFSVDPMDRSLELGAPKDQTLASLTPNLKNQKISVMEQNFIKEYRHLEDLEREKGIKFFQCIGDAPITKETIHSIKDQRAKFIADVREFMRDADVRRFKHTYDSDRVVVETNVKLPDQPRWDSFENNHFAMRRRLVGIWLRATNLLIIRNRAGKRLQKIKWKLKTEGVRNRADCRRFVIEDWKNAQNMRISDSEHEDNIENLKFKFNFN
jgi:hypothetical protein